MMRSNANFHLVRVAHDALQCKLSAVVRLHMVHSNANVWRWLGCIECTPMQTLSCGWVAHDALQCKLSALVGLHIALQCKCSAVVGLPRMHSNANFQLRLGCTRCTSMQTFSCVWVAHGALQCKLSAVAGLHMMHSNANFQLWLGCT